MTDSLTPNVTPSPTMPTHCPEGHKLRTTWSHERGFASLCRCTRGGTRE